MSTITNADMPAMPTEEIHGGYDKCKNQDIWHQSLGLTKREMFAMHAMQGIISADLEGELIEREDRCAELSVRYADALLAELDKEGNS